MTAATAEIATTWIPFPKPPTVADAVVGLTPAQEKEVKRWVELTDVLVALGGAIRAADTIIDRQVKDQKTRHIVDASLHSAYAVMQSANNAVNDEITAIRTGKMPDHPLPPVGMPDWNPTDPPDTIFQDIWQTLLPMLEMAYNLWGSKSKFGIVLYSLITAGQSVVKILDYYFPSSQ